MLSHKAHGWDIQAFHNSPECGCHAIPERFAQCADPIKVDRFGSQTLEEMIPQEKELACCIICLGLQPLLARQRQRPLPVPVC